MHFSFRDAIDHAEAADPTEGMSEREKKLFELQQRLKASRKANQNAVMQERRRKQAPEGADVASEKRKWFEEKKKRKQEDLEKLGLEEKDVRLLCPCQKAALGSGGYVKTHLTIKKSSVGLLLNCSRTPGRVNNLAGVSRTFCNGALHVDTPVLPC